MTDQKLLNNAVNKLALAQLLALPLDRWLGVLFRVAPVSARHFQGF